MSQVDALSNVNSALLKSGAAQVMKYYDEWTSTYDEDVLVCKYNGPEILAELCRRHLNTNDRIIDVCAGTGLVAKILKPLGYVNIDAHDGSIEMIESAKQQNLYNKYYVEMIMPDRKSSTIPEEVYDAVIMAGAIAPGHLNGSHLPILLTLLKNGGRFLCTARKASMTETKHEGKTALEYLDELERSSVLKALEKQDVPNYFSGEPGLALAYEKL